MCAVILCAVMDFSFVLIDHNISAVRAAASNFINTKSGAYRALILTSPSALSSRLCLHDFSK